jgi:hypothetical protein
MVVLYIIGGCSVATSCDRLNERVVLVLLQLLVLLVAQQHLCIDTGRVGTGLPLGIEGHVIALLLFLAKVGKKTELIITLVLVQVV